MAILIFVRDDNSTRVSTIDISNNFNSQIEDNFLKNSHRRVKKGSSRYFQEERVSLPQIRSVNYAHKKIPFGVKRVSCAKNLNSCFDETMGNQDRSHVQPLSTFREKKTDLYYQQPSSIEKMVSLDPNSTVNFNRAPSRRRTRNFGSTKPSLSISKILKSYETNDPIQRNELMAKPFRLQYLQTVDARVDYKDGLENKSMLDLPKGRQQESPATPSFASR